MEITVDENQVPWYSFVFTEELPQTIWQGVSILSELIRAPVGAKNINECFECT